MSKRYAGNFERAKLVEGRKQLRKLWPQKLELDRQKDAGEITIEQWREAMTVLIKMYPLGMDLPIQAMNAPGDRNLRRAVDSVSNRLMIKKVD